MCPQFEAKLVQGGLLKKILDAIKELVTDAMWDCSGYFVKYFLIKNLCFLLNSFVSTSFQRIFGACSPLFFVCRFMFLRTKVTCCLGLVLLCRPWIHPTCRWYLCCCAPTVLNRTHATARLVSVSTWPGKTIFVLVLLI